LVTSLTPNINEHLRLRAAIWAPKGNGVAFVHEGDIYFTRAVLGNDMIRLTRSNDPLVVTNGVADWVYEEEVLKSDVCMWFDDTGTKLAYLKFNDSRVHMMFYSRSVTHVQAIVYKLEQWTI
jgi:hypothetical protein